MGSNDAPGNRPGECSNCATASAKFDLLPGQACSPDYYDGGMGSCSASQKTADCCAAMCAADSKCEAFTFCEGPGTNCPGKERPLT